MEFLTDLWLPIVLSAVAVFIVSSLVHMVLQIHKGDFKKLPGEDKILEAMRSVPPGAYMFPMADSMKEMCSPAMIEKMKTSPVGSIVMRPSGAPSLGKALFQWFVFSLGISLLVGYICSLCIPKSADFATVMRVASAAATLGYGFSHLQDSIWKGVSWNISVKFLFDGLLYGLATGAVFAWRWTSGM